MRKISILIYCCLVLLFGYTAIAYVPTPIFNGYFDGTLEGDIIIEDGNAVYNASETPGGELGGTWASPTIDDSVSVSTWNLTTPTITTSALITNGSDVRVSTTTSAHEWSIQLYDNDDTTWRDGLNFANGNTPTITLGANVTLSGLGTLSLSSIDDYQVSGTSLNDMDLAFTVAQTFNAGGYTKNGATGPGFWDFYEDSDNGSNYVRIIGPSSTADQTMTLPSATDTFVGKATTDTLTNKTLDANGTGNTVKGYGYIYFLKPTSFGSGVTQQTTATDEYYGQALFVDDTDEATNYVEYRAVVPQDIDTSVDLTAQFKFRLGGADTNDHDYQISMASVADSGDYTGSVGNAIALAFDADASGADGDVETAGETTLTDWKSNVTAGHHWVIRVARDGDDGTNDSSTVDSYSGTLVIKYGFTQ